jgi:hypothetical protein
MELKREDYAVEVKRAKVEKDFVSELVQMVHPTRQTRETREMASQVLMILAKDNPHFLIDHADTFYDYLHQKNAFSKMVSLYCITGLVVEGLEPKFPVRITQFLAMLQDESVMIASHCALNAGKIARKYMSYEPQVSASFLMTNEIQHKQKDLILAYVIEAFEGFAEHSMRIDEINAFVWQQLENRSPKARQAAKHYLSGLGMIPL